MAICLTDADVLAGLSGSNKDWAYNGIDVLITRGVDPALDELLAQFPNRRRICDFEMAAQKAALTMMLRGAAIDEFACEQAIKEWTKEVRLRSGKCNELIQGVWDGVVPRTGKCTDQKPHAWNNAKNRKASERVDCPDTAATCNKCGASKRVQGEFNPLSVPQTTRLLYALMQLPKQYSRKGDHGITVDDEAIEKLIHKKGTTDEQAHVLRAILDVRKARKQIGFLRSTRSCDGRLRQSVNVGATETGRWSASKDPFRQGTNFQNIADRSRNIIVADPGLWLGYADLEQAESKIVAFDSEDEGYIAAHEAGDVHTFVAKMVWPELPWPGDAQGDREVADRKTPWDPDHSYRDYAKHVQHGGNIGQSAIGMARDAHIPVAQAKDCYERMYGQAFPDVRRRQEEIKALVATTGLLTNPLGRDRQFFGRLWDAETQREGLAQTQQSTVADLLNLAVIRVWEWGDLAPNILNAPRPSDPNKIWLLAQVHDAILFLIRPHDIPTLQKVLELMRIPVLINGRWCTIGVDVELGRNFRHFNPKKPETIGGIGKWHIEDDRIICHNTKEWLKCV